MKVLIIDDDSPEIKVLLEKILAKQTTKTECKASACQGCKGANIDYDKIKKIVSEIVKDGVDEIKTHSFFIEK